MADTYDGVGMPSVVHIRGWIAQHSEFTRAIHHVIESLQWPYPCSELEHGMFKHGVTG